LESPSNESEKLVFAAVAAAIAAWAIFKNALRGLTLFVCALAIYLQLSVFVDFEFLSWGWKPITAQEWLAIMPFIVSTIFVLSPRYQFSSSALNQHSPSWRVSLISCLRQDGMRVLDSFWASILTGVLMCMFVIVGFWIGGLATRYVGLFGILASIPAFFSANNHVPAT
jgi:hypothetical protein